eukprot:8578994-Karenia_brevis.AAC.1
MQGQFPVALTMVSGLWKDSSGHEHSKFKHQTLKPKDNRVGYEFHYEASHDENHILNLLHFM